MEDKSKRPMMTVAQKAPVPSSRQVGEPQSQHHFICRACGTLHRSASFCVACGSVTRPMTDQEIFEAGLL